MLSKLTRTLLVTTTSLTLMAGLIPTAHATTHHPQPASVSTNETTQQSTPANLPYRPLSEIRAEAQAKGLDSDATELAIEVIGGVTEFAQGMSEILNNQGQQNLQDIVTERWGKEMGFLLRRVLGYTAIVNACKDLRV